MLGVNLSESLIRHNANAKSFQRGEEYYQMNLVVSLTQRGNQIHAIDANPYPQAQIDGNAQAKEYGVNSTKVSDRQGATHSL